MDHSTSTIFENQADFETHGQNLPEKVKSLWKNEFKRRKAHFFNSLEKIEKIFSGKEQPCTA
jgi:hypothetical protein